MTVKIRLEQEEEVTVILNHMDVLWFRESDLLQYIPDRMLICSLSPVYTE